MRSTRQLAVTIGLLLVEALCACHPSFAQVWRPPVSIEAGLPVVEVWVDGKGPFRFLLDTGAEGTTVSSELAGTLGGSAIGAVSQHTVSGVARVPLVRFAEMRLGAGGPRAVNVAAAVSSLAGPRGVLRRLDGVLGGDVLDGYDYLLDYREAVLIVARGESLPVNGGVELPLLMDRRRPLVQWPVRQRGTVDTRVLLLLDSGSDTLVVEPSATAFACRKRTARTMTMETQAGRRDVKACDAESFQLGHVEVRNLRLVEVPWPASLTRRERGLLPTTAFDRLYVSPARGTVTVWPRSSRSIS
jgi:hypothetical protein